MPVLHVPKEGINHFRPSMKLGRAPRNHTSDQRCHCDMESVPMRNPLFNSGKVTRYSFQCLTTCLGANEGHTTIMPSGNMAVWLLRTRDICIRHIFAQPPVRPECRLLLEMPGETEDWYTRAGPAISRTGWQSPGDPVRIPGPAQKCTGTPMPLGRPPDKGWPFFRLTSPQQNLRGWPVQPEDKGHVPFVWPRNCHELEPLGFPGLCLQFGLGNRVQLFMALPLSLVMVDPSV